MDIFLWSIISWHILTTTHKKIQDGWPFTFIRDVPMLWPWMIFLIENENHVLHLNSKLLWNNTRICLQIGNICQLSYFNTIYIFIKLRIINPDFVFQNIYLLSIKMTLFLLSNYFFYALLSRFQTGMCHITRIILGSLHKDFFNCTILINR